MLMTYFFAGFVFGGVGAAIPVIERKFRRWRNGRPAAERM
jgi:hypothetical protein